MGGDLKEHLEHIKFEKYLSKLNQKLKNKTVIIYGSGSLFQYIKEHYDLSKLNIIGISDMKFSQEQEGQDFSGYKIIPKNKMKDYNPDVVLVATLQYLGIIEDFEINVFDKTKTKVYPLARIPLWDLIREIWSK